MNLAFHAYMTSADLCVSAALDAVKEGVVLPWNTTTADKSASDQETAESTSSEPGLRSISQRNFFKALKEITPSSSESLGSLSELRRWNDEFGEGRKDRRRKQVWGKDRFGFTDVPDNTAKSSVQVPSDNSNGSIAP
jgi:hypothetical protein